MNLIQGRLVDDTEIGAVLAGLEGKITATLCRPLLNPLLVVDACDALSKSLPDESILPVLQSLGMAEAEARQRITALRHEFSREYLLARLARELGNGYGKADIFEPYGSNEEVVEQLYPLGVLFHIAAGNMDGLPVYSVIEGLLAGNINLLKLPSVDGGLSVMILQQLFSIEPALAEYVYVFNMSSTEIDSMKQLAGLANAIVVWGGDDTVRNVRQMAPPNVKIIEWGHKLSFAYITMQGIKNEKLEGLAHNICATNQLLCSSCQGIFIDTHSLSEAAGFCKAFSSILEHVAALYPDVPLASRAQNTLQLYTKSLEGIYGQKSHAVNGKYTSILLEEDSQLTLSLQFRNVWVKRLPRENIVQTLYPYKSHLQTAALLCATDEWEPLRDTLWRAGVVRISDGKAMSESYCGAAHDGEYPLRRYTRLVSAQA